jgi:hypothetical protein
MPDGSDNLRKKESEIGASLYEGTSLSEKAQQAAERISDSYRAAGEQATAARDYASSTVSDLERRSERTPCFACWGPSASASSSVA